MFCRKCGAEIPDNAQVCDNCGTSVSVVPETVVSDGSEDISIKKKISNSTVGIAAVIAAIVVILAVLAVIFFGGRSYRAVVNEFFDSVYEDTDTEELAELFPPALLRAEFGYYGDNDSMYDMMDYYIKSELSTINVDDDRIKVKYDIVSNEKYDNDKFDELKDQLYSQYGIKPSAARSIKANYTLTVKGSNASQSDTVQLELIKMGRSWYLVGLDAVDSLSGLGYL